MDELRSLEDPIANSGEEIVDELGEEDPTLPIRYTITSYGADYPVDSLVRRLEDASIIVPDFQRNYVWSPKHASRFVESLLLGLPVPGVFFSKEPASQQMLVVDGQQRLKTLQWFYSGVFINSNRVFTLSGVQPQFEDKSYKTLEVQDRRALDDSIIHATIFRQDDPSDNQSSIYNVFERLNTGAIRLVPQEIRSSVYHGPFVDLLRELNNNSNWRSTFFKPLNKRLRDEELILRFLALYENSDDYRRPMESFLSDYMGNNKNLSDNRAGMLSSLFTHTIDRVAIQIGVKAFKPQGSFNAAVFDSLMVAVASLPSDSPSATELNFRYERLIKDEKYIEATTRATADPQSLNERIRLAKQYMDGTIA